MIPQERDYLYRYLKEKIKVHKYVNGISHKEFIRRVHLAMMWHGPFNWPGGDPEVCEMYGFEYLFPDAREMEGLPRGRFYFYFKDLDDSTDQVEVAKAFMECKNYYRYLEVWEKHAPEEFRSELYYLLSLVKMTTEGMTYEKKEIQRRGLILATGEEDYKLGIDAWQPDGTPVQIKSPATQRGM